MTEYVFILPDGSKRYEFVDSADDVFTFIEMHEAATAYPYHSSAEL